MHPFFHRASLLPPATTAVRIIETELGSPISELFDTFNTTSIAAASLGQVHVATKNGKKLAIKVQRQGLKSLFDRDLKNIKILALVLDRFDTKADGAQRDWGTIYNESARLLYKEIDYENEARNAVRFRENFKGVPWVKVRLLCLTLRHTPLLSPQFHTSFDLTSFDDIRSLHTCQYPIIASTNTFSHDALL